MAVCEKKRIHQTKLYERWLTEAEMECGTLFSFAFNCSQRQKTTSCIENSSFSELGNVPATFDLVWPLYSVACSKLGSFYEWSTIWYTVGAWLPATHSPWILNARSWWFTKFSISMSCSITYRCTIRKLLRTYYADGPEPYSNCQTCLQLTK